MRLRKKLKNSVLGTKIYEKTRTKIFCVSKWKIRSFYPSSPAIYQSAYCIYTNKIIKRERRGYKSSTAADGKLFQAVDNFFQ